MNDLITLLRICQDIKGEIEENGTQHKERVYFSRELWNDLRFELEKIANEADKAIRAASESNRA